MSFSLNKVQIIGNLGSDAENRFTSNNTAVTSFSLATTETWKDKQGQRQSDTQWHNCVAFGLSDWFVDNLKKGSKWYVEGKLKTESYEKDGVKKYATKIQVNKFGGLIPLGDAQTSGVAQTDNSAPETTPDDDLPF